MRKLIILVLLVGLSFAQKPTSRAIENTDWIHVLDTNQREWDYQRVQFFNTPFTMTNLYRTGGFSINIVDTFTQIQAAAHKSFKVDLTYTPQSGGSATAGTACPIAIVGKVNLSGDLTAANSYPGMGWGVQGQVNIVTGSTIDGSTYGSPGAVYAGLRGVVTDGSGNSTYTKGTLTAVYAEIQMNEQDAEDEDDFDIYGIYIRNQGVATSPDLTAGLYMDANVVSGGANFEIGVDINDAVIGIDISDADTAIVIGEDGTPGGDLVAWGTGGESTYFMWDDDANNYGRLIVNNASFRQYNLKSINAASMYVEMQYDTTTGASAADGGNIAIWGAAKLNSNITNASASGYAEGSGIKGSYTITGILNGDAINISGVKGEIMGSGTATKVDNIAAVSAKYNSAINPGTGDNSLFWGWSEYGVVDYGLKLEATGSGSISIGVLVVADTTGIKIDMETTEDDYTRSILSEWTAGGDMTSGGYDGIYSIVNPIKDVENVYALRGRMDLRDAGERVDVNQLHAIDGLINLDETNLYDIVDNLSVFGGAIHGAGAGDVTNEGGDGSMNIFYGVIASTVLKDFSITTNGMLLLTHEDTYLDYGVNIQNSGTMIAGLLLNNHATEGPATMTAGIRMLSAADSMTYGIDMSGASFTDSEIVTSSGAKIFSGSAATGNAVWDEVGDYDATGSIYLSTAGTMYIQVANTGANTDWFNVQAADDN